MEREWGAAGRWGAGPRGHRGKRIASVRQTFPRIDAALLPQEKTKEPSRTSKANKNRASDSADRRACAVRRRVLTTGGR